MGNPGWLRVRYQPPTVSRNETLPGSADAKSWGPFVALLLIFVVFAAFGRSLTNHFAYDDFGVLVDNPAVQDFASPIRMLVDPRTHEAGDLVRAYRPLRTLLFACEYAIFGANPAGYHAVNLLLHAAVVLLVYIFCRGLLPGVQAALVGTIFACHPLLTEVVSSIKAQDDLLAALAIMTALILFDRERRRADTGRRARYWFLLIPYCVGLLCKETTIILPALLLATWLVNASSVARARRMSSAPWGPITAMCALACAFLVLRSIALERAEPPGSSDFGLPWYFPSSLAYIPLYWKLFLFPSVLTIDYSDLLVLHLGSKWLYLSMIGQLAIVMLLWRSRHRTIRLGLVWFYILLLPSLNPLTPYFILAERFAYLSCVGLSLVAVGGASYLLARVGVHHARWVMPVACVPLSLALVVRTAVRCGDWADNEALFRSALAVNPSSKTVRGFLIRELLGQGRLADAEALLPQGEAFVDRVPRSYHESGMMALRGLLALENKAYAEAAATFRHIVTGPYVKARDWLNYGTALTELKRRDEAEQAFHRALRFDPENAAVRRMLGRIALETGRFAEASRQFDMACRLDPRNEAAWYYNVFAAWRTAGEAAALDRLAEAQRAGGHLGRFFDKDIRGWKESGPALRRAIEEEIRRSRRGLPVP